MIGIYKITNPLGQVYIGQSINIPSRWRGYRSLRAKKQPKLYNSFLNYGVSSHVFEVICICDQKELNAIELYYINEFDSFNTGLNATDGRYIKPTMLKSKEEKDKKWSEYLAKKLAESKKPKPKPKKLIRYERWAK